jgi:D-glycero-D-manno-heptose 1,7-bisphosphate phosphatase
MRVAFLDRDGVIGDNREDHVKSQDEFKFLPGALTALQLLHQAGFYTFVVTNQAIVNRGIASSAEVEAINRWMAQQVMLHGGYIHDICYCPHDTGDGCQCRKPRPGMLLQLAAKWQVDLSLSYLVGDAWTDIAAGRAAGCHTVLVRTGRGADQLALPEAQHHTADYIATDLADASAWMIQREGLVLRHYDNIPRRPLGPGVPAIVAL